MAPCLRLRPLHLGALVHSILRGSPVKVCTVAGFPSGAVPPTVKRLEAEIALRNGAQEIDMVLPLGLLRGGELDMVRQDIATVAEATAERGAVLKVILEAAALTEREIAVGCALARLGGAQFVKTSTGLHPAGGARVEHVAWMRKAVGNDLGVKAAGGIAPGCRARDGCRGRKPDRHQFRCCHSWLPQEHYGRLRLIAHRRCRLQPLGHR